MRLTTMTDYALRLLMYAAQRPERLCTIAEVAQVYAISEAHLMKVTHQLGLLGGSQAQHAFFGFAALAGVVAVQAVQAGSAVGVEHRQRSLFLREVLHGGNQNGVLEHIGVIACMEGVAVTEHRDGW